MRNAPVAFRYLALTLTFFVLHVSNAQALPTPWASNFKGVQFQKYLDPGCMVPGGVNLRFRQFGNVQFDYNVQIIYPEDENNRSWLLNPAFVAELLEHVKKEAQILCEQRLQRREVQGISKNWLIAVQNNLNLTLDLEALFKGSENHWAVTNYVYDGYVAQRQAQRAAQQMAEREGEERTRRERERLQSHVDFVRKFGVEESVEGHNLGANPFQYRNKIVSFQTNFVRMLSESDAIFGSNTEFLATKVPTTRFRGAERVVLAVKILGTKPVKTANGEVQLPYGEYVGDFPCGQECPFK